ncbi:MAG: flagellar hook-associated protein FlgK [Planctomycetota bacterium]
MAIGSAFNIGRSALQASQLGVQVASNNLANAATPGYARQVLGLEAVPGAGASTSIGRGVQFTGVRRQIDEALNARLNGAISEAAAAQEATRVLGSIETSLNELTDLDLSSELGSFFTSFSELANGTQSQSQVIEQGELLAGFMRRLRSDLVDQRTQLDDRLGALVEQADALSSEIAALNGEIVRTEGGGITTNNPLRDRRDELVRELSQLVDISTVEQASGAIDVLVGSSPIVLGARSQGIELREIPAGDTIDRRISVTATGQVLDVTAGEIGGVLASRDGELDSVIGTLDQLAGALINEINGLHATGATAAGLTSASSALVISPTDQPLALSDPLNRTLAELDFPPTNGGFLVRVVDEASGAVSTTRIDVDLDGIDDTGAAGFGDDTSIQDIAAALDAVNGLSASVGSDGRLAINASQGTSFTFGDDTSGVLAALGVNSYFTGNDAGDIAVRDELRGSPSLLMTGRYAEGSFVENGTSLKIAGIQNNAVESLGGESAAGFWRTAVQTFSVRAGSAQTVAEATAIVRDGLESERLAVSGVDTDEETLSLIQFQRQYQGAARIISTTNQLLDELFAIV